MNNEERERLIEGLREMTDWLEAHPEAPVPTSVEVWFLHTSDRKGFVAAARACGPLIDKTGGADYFARFARYFGPLAFQLVIDREKVEEGAPPKPSPPRRFIPEIRAVLAEDSDD